MFLSTFLILFREKNTIFLVCEPYDNSFWEESNGGGEKEIERKKKNAINSGHLVPLLDQLHNNNTEFHGVGRVVQVIMLSLQLELRLI